MNNERHLDSGEFGIGFDVCFFQLVKNALVTGGMGVNPIEISQVVLDHIAKDSHDAPDVGTGFDRQVNIRELGGFAESWVEDDECSIRCFGDIAHHDACALHAVGLPRIFSNDHSDIAMLEVPMPTAT